MKEPTYQQKKDQLSRQLREQDGSVRLHKATSNLFRTRTRTDNAQLDVRSLNQVISVDPARQLVEVEGMTTYEDLTDACLAHNCMPMVVPQLKSITIGGAVSGIGIESTSFRYGLPHETVTSMEVLLGNGDMVDCSPDNKHADLFFGIPNSYGTLGYILKLEARTLPVKPFVELEHIRYSDIDAYFAAATDACQGDADFIDGTIFSVDEMYLTLGRFRDEAPYASDYTWLRMYYRSIRERSQDFLSIRDYLWRWDTDWFWCSKNLYVQNLPMRMLLGSKRLNSVSYQKVMRWNNRIGLTGRINKWLRREPEAVVQDVDIPIENAAAFLRFFLDEIGITPLWMCPIGGHDITRQFPFYPLHGSGIFVNFGFWDIVPNPEHHEDGYFNRKIEAKVTQLGGIKSLYSDAYYAEDQFWKLYNGATYRDLKCRYDPNGRLQDLYQKCVQRQ